MSEQFLPGAPDVALTLRRSARARRISLRISQLDGRVTLTLPNSVPESEALAFAREKEGWIRKHLLARPEDVPVDLGSQLPVAGALCQVTRGSRRRVVREGTRLLVPEGPVGPRLQSWLKTMARDHLVAASDLYADRLGQGYARITLRDTRSRWGSCSSARALMYSWRLIMAPPEVLTYVAAHEVAHLAEMNHSQRFWSLVQDLYGPYEQPRAWLRQNGASLHRYRF